MRARRQARGRKCRHAAHQRLAVRSAPFWSVKVTVPPVGVAPPADRSLTVAVNVTD